MPNESHEDLLRMLIVQVGELRVSMGEIEKEFADLNGKLSVRCPTHAERLAQVEIDIDGMKPRVVKLVDDVKNLRNIKRWVQTTLLTVVGSVLMLIAHWYMQ